MNCRRAREGLWPPERPRLAGEEVVLARSHVETCGECQAYFVQDRALLDAYDRVRREPAPAAVRERVFDALARARWASAQEAKKGKARHRGFLAAAAIVALGALVLVPLMDWGSSPPAVDDPGIFAEDYLRRAVAQDHIVTTDPNEVQRFLHRELGMPLSPLRFAGMALERAEVCLIQGRRGAMITYKKDGATVSHYLVPHDDARARKPAVADYRTLPGGGRMPVVTWATPRLEQALVGELSAAELLRIAAQGKT